MASPTIYCIHATDAPQHLTTLKEILERLKSENRISGFITGEGNADRSMAEKASEGDLIIILLTRNLEQKKPEIERTLRVKARNEGVKVAEVIIDNVPYENEFITLPTDLMPIRSRDDMDEVWSNIEHNLKLMFPAAAKQEIIPVTNWRKYLKYAVPILLLIALFIWRSLQGNNSTVLTADFTTSQAECAAPCTINFANLSANAEVYEWDFGDGEKSSEVNPSHTYAVANKYVVTLVSKNGMDEQTRTQEITISGQADAPFTIQAVNAAVDNASFSGECPHQFTFTGTIETNKAGTVQYTWLRSDGATSAVETLNFQGPGSLTVNTTWMLGAAGSSYTDFWQQLKITSPTELLSNKATFNLTCAGGSLAQVSPAHGSVFGHFPRTTTLTWTSVSGATGYNVEVDCFHCCANGKWCTDVGQTWKKENNIQGTSYTFAFVGAQPGRWRVSAVNAAGQEISSTGWWEFTYTQ